MNHTQRKKRTGAAAVEFALICPILLTMIFASIEFSRANMIRNICENAAMEGARVGILPGATAEECVAEAYELINIMGLQDAAVTITPDIITPATTEITVEVTVPLSENALPMSKFVLGKFLRQSVTLPREFDW